MTTWLSGVRNRRDLKCRTVLLFPFTILTPCRYTKQPYTIQSNGINFIFLRLIKNLKLRFFWVQSLFLFNACLCTILKDVSFIQMSVQFYLGPIFNTRNEKRFVTKRQFNYTLWLFQNLSFNIILLIHVVVLVYDLHEIEFNREMALSFCL